MTTSIKNMVFGPKLGEKWSDFNFFKILPTAMQIWDLSFFVHFRPKCSRLGVRSGKRRRRLQIWISKWQFWQKCPSLTPSKIYKCGPILFIQNAPGRYFTVELELFYGFLVYHHRFRRRKLKTSKKACF